MCFARVNGESPFFSLEVEEQVNVLEHFPLEVGNRWTYSHFYKACVGAGTEIITITWTREVSVVAHHQQGERTLVRMKKIIRDVGYDYPEGTPEEQVRWDKEHIPNRETPHYLIDGNYIYEIREREPGTPIADFLAESDRVVQEQVPEYFFPMTVGVRWAEKERETRDFEMSERFLAGEGPAPNPGMYYWVVEATEAIEVPCGRMEETFCVIYRTLGGPSRYWFKNGLGVVKTAYRHCGSYYEFGSELVACEIKGHDPAGK
jgi:hypothetical protein